MLVFMDQIGSHFELYKQRICEITETTYAKYFALAESCNPPIVKYVICMLAGQILEEYICIHDHYSSYSPLMYALAGLGPTLYYAPRLSSSQWLLFFMVGSIIPLLSYADICQTYLRPIYGFYVMLPCLESVFTLQYAIISFYLTCITKGILVSIFVGWEEHCYLALTTTIFVVFGTSKSILGRLMMIIRFTLYCLGYQGIIYVKRYHKYEAEVFPPLSGNEAFFLFSITTIFAYVMVECIQLHHENPKHNSDQSSAFYIDYTDSEVEDRSFVSTGSEIIEESTDTLHSDFLPQDYRLHIADMRQTKRFKMFPGHPSCGRQCAICQNELQINDDCRQIKVCVHVFHSNCIEPWFRMNMKCPLCKREVRNPLPNEKQDIDVSLRKTNNQYHVLSYQMTMGEND